MEKLKNVIKGLECCVEHDGHDGWRPDLSRCEKCPYEDYDFCVVPWQMMKDALEMLKEFAKDSNVPDKNVGQWISVKDRMPEYYGIMLISDGKNVGIGYYDQFWREWLKRDYDGDTVTHWMPMPEPPEED